MAGFEPLSQLGSEFFSGYAAMFVIVGGLLIYLINFTQLIVFRRDGFLGMIATRIGMYSL